MGRLIWIWVNESINPIFESIVDVVGFGIFSEMHDGDLYLGE
jgi:hypothetical protein